MRQFEETPSTEPFLAPSEMNGLETCSNCSCDANSVIDDIRCGKVDIENPAAAALKRTDTMVKVMLEVAG